MQSLRSLLAPVLAGWMCFTSGPVAQTPTREAGERARAASPANQNPQPRREAGQDPARRRRGGRFGGRARGPAWTLIEAGMVHPVSGPPIKNGVVLVQGDRIFAVGQQGNLRLPANTKVLKFPDGHVYPGLIDASTDAFADAALRRDRSLNGGSKIADGLLWTDSRDDHLVEHGVTTAYVTVRPGQQLSGQGAVVRPRKDGFELWKDKEQAAVQLRMTTGNGSSHPLQRQTALESVGKIFDGLDKYIEAQEKYEKDLEKYEEDFAKYIEHHAKKNGKDKKEDKKPAPKGDGKADESKKDAKPATEGTSGRPSGRRGRRGEGRPPRREPPKGGELAAGQPDAGQLEELDAQSLEALYATMMALTAEPQAAQPQGPQGRPSRGAPQGKPGASAQSGGKPGDKKEGKDSGPKRPTYPKKPREDLQKEALNKVLDGDLPLRIEAHRVDELRAALALKREKEVPVVVLEKAYGADRVAKEIAEEGATVVLTDVLPFSLAAPGDTRNAYAKFDPTSLPRKLNDIGVPFAIAGGTARMSAMLPMMAAAAIGNGLSEDAALRAITLTPAEILGVQKDTGSLTRGKLADLIVTSGPLFASDSRMLLVLSKGRTEYEAK